MKSSIHPSYCTVPGVDGAVVSVAVMEVSETTISQILGSNPSTLTLLNCVVGSRANGFRPVTCRKVVLIQEMWSRPLRIFWGSRVRIPVPATL